jgi:carbon storage regulator
MTPLRGGASGGMMTPTASGTLRKKTMLVLSRRPEESIAIGSNITVVVLGIKGNQVRLGFRAPRDVVIDRTEVQHRKRVEPIILESVTQSP